MKTQIGNGWMVQNGSGWNSHTTARAMDIMIAESPGDLPTVPVGYAVLVAPVHPDKPFGLRCALVRVLPRLIEDGLDDGPDGERYEWAADAFGCDVERIYSCTSDQQDEDSSQYFIRKMREQIELVNK